MLCSKAREVGQGPTNRESGGLVFHVPVHQPSAPAPPLRRTPHPQRSAGAPQAAAAQPARDRDGGLVFADHPEFRPRLSPSEVIRRGSFGGCYFNPRGGRPGKLHPKGIPGVTHTEFPPEWFAGLSPALYASRKYEIKTNAYGVNAGQNQAAWEVLTRPLMLSFSRKRCTAAGAGCWPRF